ncbi:metal-dependent hydrolase [Novosphingobium cyanobacteriorum]|uniref:Metal-dependent hydrolase n=1 Tax=Novosphingobium cyanobacteriorum TaxID=3024215 RepID=A0ABT6CGE8_9SPHN|nr:metal-dependent hydrolase [Novosphingobium cyanobacteriorum]MDF8332543.1 metal-dependent hydrolase [Novosphingobium cyanobacteriorum]
MTAAVQSRDVDLQGALGKARTATPADLTLTVRDRRFGRNRKPGRWWLAGDPVASNWYNALSLTFPRGETFFIESVKAFREGVPPRLEAEIRDFIKQEINHTREHLAFNRAAEELGYHTAAIDARLAADLEETKDRPPIANLAATMALEHFTAILALELLRTPAHLKDGEEQTANLWRWHSIEEIEHKGVAYDTWLHATRDWSRWERWKVKSLLMLLVTREFIGERWKDTLELLAQDGLTGWRVKARLAAFLLVRPGLVSRIFPLWVGYFLPGFHPWNHDDRALIAEAEARLGTED